LLLFPGMNDETALIVREECAASPALDDVLGKLPLRGRGRMKTVIPALLRPRYMSAGLAPPARPGHDVLPVHPGTQQPKEVNV
jgi:hypothetical protein